MGSKIIGGGAPSSTRTPPPPPQPPSTTSRIDQAERDLRHWDVRSVRQSGADSQELFGSPSGGMRLYGEQERGGGGVDGRRQKNLNIFAKLKVFIDGVQDHWGGDPSLTEIPNHPLKLPSNTSHTVREEKALMRRGIRLDRNSGADSLTWVGSQSGGSQSGIQ